MTGLAKFVLGKFFETARQNKKAFMELCFWLNIREAEEVTEGYAAYNEKKTKSKKCIWTEEEEETLKRTFEQFSGMRENDPTVDVLEGITLFFEEKGKTSRNVIRKLKEMGLIQVRTD